MLIDTRMLRAGNVLHNSTVVLKLAHWERGNQGENGRDYAWQTLRQRLQAAK